LAFRVFQKGQGRRKSIFFQFCVQGVFFEKSSNRFEKSIFWSFFLLPVLRRIFEKFIFIEKRG